ncbi:GNAT family N-acetyltransferase [Alkalicoccobacillus porphyridii]|uniref:GNAT family N-acetyltransferase n=1 Tax=Alkalicoccobacillus porphyridii TaxID=2597270 RepID=A0A553ZZW8_9BACI|nr:GNAT family protein [Alkalicoccobacillus porphyridii]TSB46997.1 GNAT family N-acetyltransferase [Alkalicoccobacillus porphyridii]
MDSNIFIREYWKQVMEGDSIYLRSLKPGDEEKHLHLHMNNKHFFERYAMKRIENYYTLEFQKHLLEQFDYLKKQGTEYHFGIYTKDSNELIGTTELYQLFRGALQSAHIGYSVAKKYNGAGYASEACRLITTYAFTNLKLHRVEAGVMPRNKASIRVLEKNGYVKEGIARKNVRIQGIWEDHQILAIINPEDV